MINTPVNDKEETMRNICSETKRHPCFSEEGHKSCARMHLPVAPACNINCNYCRRDFDCANESRPGVTSDVLTPEEGLQRFKAVREKIPNTTVVGFAGPGDALANFDNIRQTVELIKEVDPEVVFCLSTNGLMLPFYVDDIINLGICHVTITINAIDKEIGDKIYSIPSGSLVLIRNQLSGLKALAEKSAVVKVNIVAIKGINDHHIEDVAKKVKELGAYKTNIMQLIPAEGTKFEGIERLSNKELNEIRKKCSKYINQMYHCQQCRADAIGMLNQDRSFEFRKSSNKTDAPEQNQKYIFAVASETGELVDLHFGKADKFLIYEYSKGDIKRTGTRNLADKYCTGIDECESKDGKSASVMQALEGCDAVISLRIGPGPKQKLEEKNIKSFEIYNTVEGAIKKAVELLGERNYAKT